MGMIPLPNEEATKIRKETKQKSRKVIEKDLISQIKDKLKLKEVARDKKIVGDTCIKMVQYIKGGKDLALSEIKDLLHGLERSIISIQKDKRKAVEKENKKQK